METGRDLGADLEWLVGRIRDGYEPEKIILFGSLARGETHEDSDIDLIIYSLEEYENARKRGSSFLKEAEEGGLVLYERHD
ncbi:MAG: nucleotidyltransferase domain-containing protein [Rubrobacteraceae bacterium]